MAFDDLDTHRAVLRDLDRRRVPVVWTAHNLTPHEKRPEAYDPIYELWAEQVDAIIHHSFSGMERFRHRYPTGPRTQHVVIPHGHFGDLWADHAPEDRAAAEAALGLPPCGLRIGIVGAPRREKLVGEFLRGVVASHRTDVQVACWSLEAVDEVPDDPRIVVAEPYEMADAASYATRLAACDVLAMPFDPDGEMLATGTAFDAIGRGDPRAPLRLVVPGGDPRRRRHPVRPHGPVGRRSAGRPGPGHAATGPSRRGRCDATSCRGT